VNAFNRLQFEITTLNQWKNCDIFIDDAAPKTTVMCFFAEHFDPSVYLNGTAFPAAAVYFKPANVNALIKFYQPILNAPLNKSGFYSEENSLPIGTRGTLIAVSFENGKLYVDQRDITVQAPQNGEKAVFFALHPVETDPSVFLSNLGSL
jgi:DNA-binding beta-propeller fold protein YncE